MIGCKGQPVKNEGDLTVGINNTSNESMSSEILDDFEIIEFSFQEDTLRIVSTSSFLYYPFGCYISPKEFLEQYSFTKKHIKQDRITVVNSDTELYCFSLHDSYIKFLYDEEKNRMELFSARVADDDFLLENGIKIGISKADFISRFTSEITLEQIKDITIVEFISGVLGIWHYYVFEEEILTSFYINTDYQFDKD